MREHDSQFFDLYWTIIYFLGSTTGTDPGCEKPRPKILNSFFLSGHLCKQAKREAWQEELSLSFTQDNEENPVQDTEVREQVSQSSIKWQRTPQKRGSLVKYYPLKNPVQRYRGKRTRFSELFKTSTGVKFLNTFKLTS